MFSYLLALAVNPLATYLGCDGASLLRLTELFPAAWALPMDVSLVYGLTAFSHWYYVSETPSSVAL